jgi:hypothetical protein
VTKHTRFCSVGKALSDLEAAARRKAKAAHDMPTQVVQFAVSIELQKTRLAHECLCSRCLHVEAA